MTIPNYITIVRILGAIGLLFTKPFSVSFYVLLTLCGFTDILDGWIARRTNSTSELGAKLDSVADLLFQSVSLIKILPTLWKNLPLEIWYGVGAVLVVRAIAYIVAAIKFHRFASMHTYANKATGGILFSLPYLAEHQIIITVICTICFFISGYAAIEELVIHIRSKEYNPGIKTILKPGA